MADRLTRPSWALLVAVAVTSAIVGWGAGFVAAKPDADEPKVVNLAGKKLPEDYFKWDPKDRIAQDAARRWAETSGETLEEIYSAYIPVGISTATRDCVQLVFTDYSVGGQPSYCYRAGSLELVEEHNDE